MEDASSLAEDDIQGANSHQSDGGRVTNAPQTSSRLPSKILRKEKESMGDKRNALLAVAALIASATYQAILQPPSFLTKVDSNSAKGFQGYSASWITGSLGRDFAYIAFISGNTFGFLVSVLMIICLTRGLPVRLLLLLSVTAMVQTYYCFTYYLPFTLLDKAFGLKNVELLSVLPVTMSILLLLAQRWLALALDFCLKGLSWLNNFFNIVGDMYSLSTQPEEESIGNVRNTLLVVAALIASTTYQAVLQPPSFTIKADDNSMKGFLTYYSSWVTHPLGRDLAYIGFISGNTFGFLLSIQMIICLTRDLPLRLPLLLSVTALVQTYCCFTYYLPFTLLDKENGLKNAELLSVVPVTMSILLLLAQKPLALALDSCLKRLSQFNFLGDMCSLVSDEGQSVVAVLIASTTYQAVLQPPRFMIKVDDNSTKGFLAYYASWVTGHLGRDVAYIGFISGNTFGFLLSIQMIICLTRKLPVRLPLLLSVTALVQTYYCFTYYLPFTLLDKSSGLKNVELLSVLPVTMSILLLLAQRRLALALDFCLERLSRSNFLGDMYSLRTQSPIVNDREMKAIQGGAEHERGRTNSPDSGQVSVEESTGDIRSAPLAVATLIASATYQSVLQPPSFTIKVDDNSTKGFLPDYASWVTCPLGRDLAYIGFISGNTFGLLLSIQMIICLTRDLPLRLPLLLSVTALVQTYYCFTYFLPFTLLDKAFGLKNVELLSVLPVTMLILLVLAQSFKILGRPLKFWLEKISRSYCTSRVGDMYSCLVGDMYSLPTQPVVNAPDGAERERGRSISLASRHLEEGQSDWEPVTNPPQSLSSSQSNNLNKAKESMGDKRNTLLVVAALIASATYQAVLQPPGFLTKVNSNSAKGFQGYYASWITGSLGRDFTYVVFISGNTFGFLVSVQMIICLARDLSICLTRDLSLRLLLLLSVTAMVQTYYCFTYYLPFTLLDKAFGLKNVELLSVLPLMISILLLRVQWWVAQALDSCLKLISK